MAKKIWQSFIQDAQGNAIPNATVSVNGGSATIYADAAGTPKANPFTASAQGYAFFFADEGEYSVTATSGDLTFTFAAVEIGAPDKQSTLVSGASIKTINGNSLLGSGDLIVGGGGSGPTWEAVKFITVGTGGDYSTMEAAQEAVTTGFAGYVLNVTFTSDVNPASPLIVAFPTYMWVEFALSGFIFGPNLFTISGGKDAVSFSGSGTIDGGPQVINYRSPLLATAGVITAPAPLILCDAKGQADISVAGTLALRGTNLLGTVSIADGVVEVQGGNSRTSVLDVNNASAGGDVIDVSLGGVASVGHVEISGADIDTVYNLSQGIIFAGTITGTYANQTNSPAASAGQIYGP